MNNLLLGTRSGVVICERDGDAWREAGRGLPDKNVTNIIARGLRVLAGTTDGIFRSDDAGHSWRESSTGLSSRHIRSLAIHPDEPGLAFAGTEPAGIFVSRDGGESWRSCPEVPRLRDQFHWALPYSPEAGCVRGFAFLGTRGYAAVEVGGVLSSDDSGETWHLVEGSSGSPEFEAPPGHAVHADVHSVSVHAWSRDAVLAPTGGGLYRSTDGGKDWALLYECYCRAAWQNSEDPQNILLGPAGGVDRDGRIEATNDGGLTWLPASEGLDVPWRRGMVERFQQVGEHLIAVLSNGQLLQAEITDLKWRRILPAVPSVAAACELTA